MYKTFEFSFLHADGDCYYAVAEVDIDEKSEDLVAIKDVVVYSNKSEEVKHVCVSDEQITSAYAQDLYLKEMSSFGSMWVD